jgi:4-amino-4-deoxy-L-arabinose transferase-like glycosyltransferase
MPRTGDRRRPVGKVESGRRRERGGREEKPLSRKWTGIILLSACAVSVLIGVLAFDRLPSTIGDNAEFMILARSIASGNGFRYINHPDNRPATKDPVGFPAMLAGWIKIFGASVVSMKVCVLVCYVVTAGLTFLLGKRLIGWSYAMLASLMVALSATTAEYYHQVLSDIPYMMFSLVAIYLLVSGYRRRSYLVAGLAVCIWAFVVRSAGASLVFAACVFLFLRGRKREAVAALGITALIAVLWSLRNYSMTGEGSRYMQVLLSANPYDPDQGRLTLAGLVHRGLMNAGGYLGGLLPVTLLPTLIRPVPPGGAGGLNILVSLLVMILVLIGGYDLRRRGLLVNIYLLAYFAVYLVWPEVWKSERFMVPIAPLAAIYLIRGLRTVLGYFDAKKSVILTACALLVATDLVSVSSYIGRDRGYPAGWARYLETAQWARANTDQAAVILCRKPFLYYLFSERKTIAYPFTRDKNAMRDYLYQSRPDYIVLDNFGPGVSQTEVYLVPVLEGMKEYLSLAYETAEPVNRLLRLRLPEGAGE